MKTKLTAIILVAIVLIVSIVIFTKNSEETPDKDRESAGQIENILTTKKNEAITSALQNEDEVLENHISEENGQIIGTLIVKDDTSEERLEQLKSLYEEEIDKHYKDTPSNVKVERESENSSNNYSNAPKDDKKPEDSSDNQGGKGSMKLTDLPEASLKVQVTPLNMTQVVLMVEELPEDLASASKMTLYYDGKTFELTKSKTGRSLQHTFEENYDVDDIKEKATIGL